MTPNGTAIRAIRKAQRLSIRQLAHLTGLDRGYLSRVERGLAGASEDTIRRIAEALKVPPADITRGEDVSTTDVPERAIPAPNTPEGQYKHYTPEEAADWLPYTAGQLRKKAMARQIAHHGGGQGHKITFTGRDICEITDALAVRPVGEKPTPKRQTTAA